MLLSFIGAPCSGKTTVAALVFAALKEAGQAVEFVPEKAREYIASYRVSLSHADPAWDVKKNITLTDKDQLCIMKRQAESERDFREACPTSLIVADSSPLNTLLYMSPDLRSSPEVQTLITLHLRLDPVVFYCPPLPSSAWPYDPGRIHDEKTSLGLDAGISAIILPLLKSPPLRLNSSTAQHRAHQVLTEIWKKLGEAIGDNPPT